MKMDHIEQNKKITQNKIRNWGGKITHLDSGGKERHDRAAEIIKTHFPSNDAEIIDLGGREGFLCDSLKEIGYKNFYIIDISNEAIELAKERGYKAEIKNIETIETIDKKFDVVIASHILEHCPDPQKIIESVHNILNNDGIFFIEVPKQKKEKIPTKFGHWFCFESRKELHDMFDEKWNFLFENVNLPIKVLYKKVK